MLSIFAKLIKLIVIHIVRLNSLVCNSRLIMKNKLILASIVFLFFLAILLPFSASHADNGEEIVYVTDTGDCYHAEGCSYLRSSKNQTTLLSAVKSGYTPCSKCHPPILDYDPGPIESRHKQNRGPSKSGDSSSSNKGVSSSGSKKKESSRRSGLGTIAAFLVTAGVLFVPFSLASIETKKTGKRKAHRKYRSR